jgi:hypothetical protein
MNLWGKGRQGLLFLLLAIFACDDDSYLMGIKSPDENFKVVYTEFKLPTTVFMVDSLVTHNTSTSGTKRLLVGSYNDPRWGTASAASYMQFYPSQFPAFADTTVAGRATFDHITLTLMYDLYTYGSRSATSQTYDFYALDDSLVNSGSYSSKSVTPLKPGRIGTVTDVVDPLLLDDLATENNKDQLATNDVYDSLNVTLDPAFGQEIFNIMTLDDSVSMVTYRPFSRWRRFFKGISMQPVSTDKVVGFAPGHAKSRMILYYKESGVTKQIVLLVSPDAFQMSYSSYNIDRGSSLVGPITQPYQNFDPIDGSRYIQSGGGIVTRLDLSPVYDYFEAIAVKSLNAVELSIRTTEQQSAPLSFSLRAVNNDNRTFLAITKARNESYDSIRVIDSHFMGEHFISSSSAPRADILADDGNTLTLDQKTADGVSTYKGFMTTFLQREVELPTADRLRYFSIIPNQPDFSKSFNGMIFHKDSVKLRIYYTTPIIEE